MPFGGLIQGALGIRWDDMPQHPNRYYPQPQYEVGFDGRPLQQQRANPMENALRAIEEKIDQLKAKSPPIPLWFKKLRDGDLVKILNTPNFIKDKLYKVSLKDYSGCYVYSEVGAAEYVKFWNLEKPTKLKLPTWF